MSKYLVAVSISDTVQLEVEAEDEEEAMLKAEKQVGRNYNCKDKFIESEIIEKIESLDTAE